MMYYTNSKMLKELALHRNRGEKAFIKMIINSGLIQINHSILYYLSQKFTVKNLLSMNKISTNSLLSVKHAIMALAFIAISNQISFAQVLPPVSGPCLGGTAIGGKAYMDMNFDGTDDATGGFGGVYVYLYDNCSATPDVPVDSLLTDAAGNYFFTQPAGNYRIEFELKGECDHLVFGPAGPSGTDVQFVTAPGCNFSVGVANPELFCQTDPFLVVPCYVNGDNTGAEDVMIRWTASNTGGSSPLDKTAIGAANQLGSVWGTAYHSATETIFTAATLKRHVGIGPGGLDAIYEVDPTGATAPSIFIELDDDLGIDVGESNLTIGRNSTLGSTGDPSNDPSAYEWAGKIGIGDIEISGDQKTLYVLNIFDNTIYAIDVLSKALVGTFPLPSTSCTSGIFRSWALGVREGKIFAGGICDASASGKNAAQASPTNLTDITGTNNLTAVVYQLNPGSGTFTQVLNFDLDYEREATTNYNGSCPQGHHWYPWVGAMELPTPCDGTTIGYPQPILSDIEFDNNGGMILGFADRTGFQIGNGNYGPTGTTLYSIFAGGDILYACKSSTGWVIEGDVLGGGVCENSNQNNIGDPSTPDYTFAGSDPRNPRGEYFGGDFFRLELNAGQVPTDFFPAHPENTIGSLVFLPKNPLNEVISASYDPVNGSANGGEFPSGGVIKLNTINGRRSTNNGFEIYGNTGGGLFGKGVGLGDLEALCNSAPFQVGSYVWEDTDNDGIQDPCSELPIAGLQVSIYDTSNLLTPIATTTTNPDGSYYFDNTDIDPATPYYIVFGNGTSPLVENGAGASFVATTSNTGEGLSPDNNDSDGVSDPALFNGAPHILFTSPVSGSNFSLDLGLVACTYIQNPSAAQNICEGAAGADMTVETGVNDADAIKFVVFTTDQMAGAFPTPAEATAIYSGAMIGMAVTPTGTEPFVATLTAAAADWANMVPGTYYVYGILNVGASEACMPAAEIIITIAERPTILATDYVICESGPGAGAVIDLSTIVQNPDGATLTFTDLASSPYNTPHNFAAGGPYSVDVIASNPAVPGCESRDTFIVEVLPFPELVVINDTICRGSSVDLNTLVVSHTGDDLEFYTTLIDAQNGTNELFSVNVTPTIATNYFVKSVLDPTISGCETISKVTLFLRSANCYSIGVSGP